MEASAFKNYTNQYVMHNTADYKPIEFLEYAKPAILNIFNSNRNIKTILYLHCHMEKIGDNDNEIAEFAFHSNDLKLVLEGTDISELYDEMADEIEEEIQKVQDAEGSGWVFVRVIKLVLHTTKWEPIYGSSCYCC